MAKDSRYRWRNLRTYKDSAPTTVTVTRGSPRSIPWKRLSARFAGTCSCGCGGRIMAGESVLWKRDERRVVALECAERLGIRPGSE